MKDVMLDFETFGNGPNACICQVGSVYFDKVTGELGHKFKRNVNAQSHIDTGAKVNSSNIYWWLEQSEAARKSICAPGEHILQAMIELNQFLRYADRIWSHATFDFVLLMNTLQSLNIKPTFGYKCGLDLRTLIYLAGSTVDKNSREGTHHDALDDAMFQVKYAVEALTKIRGDKVLIGKLKSVFKE